MLIDLPQTTIVAPSITRSRTTIVLAHRHPSLYYSRSVTLDQYPARVLGTMMPSKQPKKQVRFDLPDDPKSGMFSKKAALKSCLKDKKKATPKPILDKKKKTTPSRAPPPPKRKSRNSSDEGEYEYKVCRRTEVRNGVENVVTTRKLRHWR